MSVLKPMFLEFSSLGEQSLAFQVGGITIAAVTAEYELYFPSVMIEA